jgi:hypothetical protein
LRNRGQCYCRTKESLMLIANHVECLIPILTFA